MKKPSTEPAFALVELLAVIFVIAILATVLLSALADRNPRFNFQCLANQHQLASGFLLYKNDHNGQLPWQVLNTNGVVTKFVGDGHAASQFKAIYLGSFDVFICPADHTRNAATNYAAFSDANTSYFVDFDVGTNQAFAILTGDRHLVSNGNQVKPGLFNYSNGFAMNWSRELHTKLKWPSGGLSFADGHAEVVRGSNLTSVFERQGSITNLLAIP
jgi:competence protein ComGC